MYKYLTLVFALFLIAPALYADDDFCEEDKPCDGAHKDKEIFCPYCSHGYFGYYYESDVEDEALHSVNTWPSKHEDSFMDALSR